MEGWINDLGIKYTSIEKDFSNGYILGSILYRYNLQDDFGSFSTKPNSAVSNLSKVQLSLEKFGIKLNANRIIGKEPGYIVKVLSQIHKGLHNISYSNLKAVRGKSAVSMKRATKFEIIENGLKKYDEIRVQQSEKALNEEKKQMETIRQGYLGERKKQIDILKSNKMFMQQWDLEGKKNWKKNQMRKTARVKHEETVFSKIVSEKSQKKVEYKNNHCEQVVDGIQEFEKNMIRLGIDHPPDQKDVKKKKIDIKTEAMVTMAKIVERKCINMEATKEREIRQRKLIVEQKKNEKFDSYKKGSVRVWNVLKGIFGRQYLSGFSGVKKYAKNEKNFKESLKRTEDLFRITTVKWGKIELDRQKVIEAEENVKKKSLASEREKINKKILESKKKSLSKHFQECVPILDLIFEISEEGSEYLKSHEKIPEKLWQTWLSLFKENNAPDYKPLVLMTGRIDNIKELLDVTFSSMPDFNLPLLEEYLNNTGQWHCRPYTPNHTLGDILESIIPIAYPEAPDPPFPDGPNYLPLKVLLLGPPFSGKKTQSKKLQELFGLKVLEVPKIIEDAKKVVQRKSEPDDPKKKKPVEEEPEIFVQASLETVGDDELGRSKLIRARLRGLFGDSEKKIEEEVKKPGKKEEVKCLGYLLLNYPETIQEATDLERHLSSFVHPSELPESISEVKKKEALLMAKPSVKPAPPKKLFRSAWDLVVFLDVDLSVSTIRAVDRRIDPAGNIYNLHYNPPADNILAKCKPIEHPNQQEVLEMYGDFNKNKNTLMHWFAQFGTRSNSNFLVVQAHKNIDTVTDSIKNKINEILKLKANQEIQSVHTDRNIISHEQAKVLIDYWEDIKEKYQFQQSYFLSYIKIHYELFENALQQQKNIFLEFLQSPDEKPNLFNNYYEVLAYTIKSKNIFSSAEIQQFNTDLDDLSDRIWDIIMARKDNAIAKHEELASSPLLAQQIAGILHISLNLLQNEISKYYAVTDLLGKFYFITEGKEHAKVVVPMIHVNWDEWSYETIGFNLLDYIVSSAKSAVLEKSQETSVFMSKVEIIENFARNAISNYTKMYNSLNSSMDFWVCKAVELENAVMVSMTNSLKKIVSTRVVPENLEFPSNTDILLELVITPYSF